MDDKKLSCLLIGGGGFVGSWLAKNLVDKGHKVTILDSHSNYFHLITPKFKLINDFRKRYLLKNIISFNGRFQDIGHDLIRKNNYNFIVHLAAHAADKPMGSEMSHNQITN